MKTTLLTSAILITAGTFVMTGPSFASGTHSKPHAAKAQQHMSPDKMKNDGHGHKQQKGHGHKKNSAPDHPHDDDEHASKAGQPGDPKKPARIVVVTMGEGEEKMYFKPDKLTVRKGEQIRFRIKNVGLLAHEFVIGTHEEILKHRKVMQKFPNMEHDDPNSIRLKEKQSGEILWKFTQAGEFSFACLIPGHMESGMKGIFMVKAPAKN